MRKTYRSPELRSEKLDVGVFGSYGSSDSGGGAWGSIIGIFNPLFGLCCS